VSIGLAIKAKSWSIVVVVPALAPPGPPDPVGHRALSCDIFRAVSTARKTNPPKNPDAWKDALRKAPKGPPLSPDQLKDIERFEKERAAGARGRTLDEAEELLFPRRK
jgi:hypothetical protein